MTLVTDVDSAVSSLILESRAQGVVAGGYNRRLSMEFVSQDAAVKEGDTVITSGLGGSYPPGLVIGRVTGVSGQPPGGLPQRHGRAAGQPVAARDRAGHDQLRPDQADRAVSYYIGLPLLLLVALVEASVLPMFRVAGLQPNLVLVLLVAWLMVRGAERGLRPHPGRRLLPRPRGRRAHWARRCSALAPLAFLQELRGAQLREGGLILTIVFTVVMTFIYHFVYLVVFTLQGAVRRAGSTASTRDHRADGAAQRRRRCCRSTASCALASQELRRAVYA